MDEDKGWITSGFLSKHLGTDQKFNENNAGMGYKSEDGWLGGYYRNSLDKDSFYGGKEFQTDPLIGDKLRLAIVLGLVSGYNKNVMPMALPEILYGDKQNETALGLVPPIKGVTPATLALQFRKRF